MTALLPTASHPEPALIRRYERAAPGWQRGIDWLGYPAAYASLVQALPPAARVLDAGAGTGAFALALIRAGMRPERLDLLDPSAAMLARADMALLAAGQPVICLQRGLQGAPIDRAPYDLILCAHLIEHFADPVEALILLHRALRPGGQLALVTSRPHWCTALVRMRWRHAALPAAIVGTALAQAGFAETRHLRFPNGPPSRMSHAFIATRKD